MAGEKAHAQAEDDINIDINKAAGTGGAWSRSGSKEENMLMDKVRGGLSYSELDAELDSL